MDTSLENILNDTKELVIKIENRFGKFNSLHEGMSVLYEEVEELWDICKQKQESRDLSKVYTEASDIAPVACRIAIDISKEIRGRK
jgi:hypothetical protein